MSDEAPPTSAEQRLQQHLLVLREDPPQPGMELVRAVVRQARWQRAVRGSLRAFGRLLSATVGGLALATGLRRGARER